MISRPLFLISYFKRKFSTQIIDKKISHKILMADNRKIVIIKFIQLKISKNFSQLKANQVLEINDNNCPYMNYK